MSDFRILTLAVLIVLGACFVPLKPSSVDVEITALPLDEHGAPKTEESFEAPSGGFRTVGARRGEAAFTSAVERPVTRSTWSERKALARKLYSSDRTGLALAVATAYLPAAGESSQEGRLFERALARIHARPREALRELSAALPLFPDELEDSRRFLVQQVARFEIEDQEKISFLQQDLDRFKHSGKKGEDLSPFSISLTFDSLMDVTKDQTLLDAEVSSLVRTYGKTPAVRTLIARYALRYPAAAARYRDLSD